jgi:hypothetical protein
MSDTITINLSSFPETYTVNLSSVPQTFTVNIREAQNGTNGVDGVDGVDGITPLLQGGLESISVSTDNGSTYNVLVSYDDLVSGSANATNWNSAFNSVKSLSSVWNEASSSLPTKANLAGGNVSTGDQSFDSGSLYVDSVNHRIGINTTSPTVLFQTTENFNHTSGAAKSTYFAATWSPGSSNAAGYATCAETRLGINPSSGFNIASSDTGIVAHGYTIVYSGGSSGNGATTTGNIAALKVSGQIVGYGTISNHYGLYVDGPRDYSSANKTIGTEYGVNVSQGTSTKTTFHGVNVYTGHASKFASGENIAFNVQSVSLGGGTNSYGLKVGTLAGAANNYGIYVDTNPSYFGGNVGIGTTAPSEKLEVSGNIKASGYKTGALTGTSGNFTSNDGKTVTVTNGLITSII